MIYRDNSKIILVGLGSVLFVGIITFVLLNNNVREQARENFVTWKTTNSYFLQEGNYLRPFNNYTAMVYESKGLRGATLINYKENKTVAKLSFDNTFDTSDFVGRKFHSIPNGIFNYLAGGDVGGGYIVVFEYYSLDAVWIFVVFEMIIMMFIMFIAYFSYGYAKKIERNYHVLNLDKIRNVNAAARHDIKSVIGHLRGLYLLSDDSHQKKVLEHSCKRLSALSTINFTENEGESSEGGQIFCISGVVKDLSKEKFVSWKAKNIKILLDVSPACIGSLVKCDYQQILRILSNIIDNAAESVNANEGVVDIRINNRAGDIEVTILDNGSGVREKYLESIGRKHFTTKENGEGIALFHASQYLRSCGGYLAIRNRIEGKGAEVIVRLPEVSNSINFEDLNRSYNTILSIDDEKSVCEQIKIFVDGIGGGVEFFSTQRSSDFKTLVGKHGGALALVDFDLGVSNQNGLEIVEDVKSSVLPLILSNRFDDSRTLSECLEKNISFVPKNLYREFLQKILVS